MCKLSVIIPAYQAAKTIEKCVQSILENQTDIEVLIVNDGSSDGTEKACIQLANGDARVRIYAKENGGPGAARELALSYATGNYITFADADDYLEPHAYDRLMPYLSEKVEIVEFGFIKEYIDGSIILRSQLAMETYSGSHCALHFARQKNTTNYLWNKVFHRSLFEGIVFPHLYTGEDAVVLTQLFTRALHCRAVPDVLYHYVMTRNSLCRSPFSLKRMDNILAYSFIDEFYAKHAPELCLFSKHKLCSIAVSLYCECKRSSIHGTDDFCKKIAKTYMNTRKELGFYKLFRFGSFHRRMMFLFFELSPHICVLLYGLIR